MLCYMGVFNIMSGAGPTAQPESIHRSQDPLHYLSSILVVRLLPRPSTDVIYGRQSDDYTPLVSGGTAITFTSSDQTLGNRNNKRSGQRHYI